MFLANNEIESARNLELRRVTRKMIFAKVMDSSRGITMLLYLFLQELFGRGKSVIE